MIRRGFFRSITGAVAGLIAGKVVGQSVSSNGTRWVPETMIGNGYRFSRIRPVETMTIEQFAAMPYRDKWLGAGGQAMETAAVNGHAEQVLPSRGQCRQHVFDRTTNRCIRCGTAQVEFITENLLSNLDAAVPLSVRMERLSFFDTIRCETCGVIWTEHVPFCSNHHNRDTRTALFVECVRSGQYKNDHLSACRNGLEAES